MRGSEMKMFKFTDRVVRISFFEEDPIVTSLTICDQTDHDLMAVGQKMVDADRVADMDARRAAYQQALESVLGRTCVEQILSRTDTPDCFAIYSVFKYVLDCYGEQKRKKLMASVR